MAAAKQKAAQSKEWLARIKPYIFAGDKQIRPRPVSDAQSAKEQLLFVADAQKLLSKYKKTDFPAGRTDDLENAAKELAELLAKAPENRKKSAENLLNKAVETLQRAKRFLGDESWKTDKTKTPIDWSNESMQELARPVDAYAMIVPPDDKRLAALRKEFALIQKFNRERREAGIDRVRMKAEKYKGKDKDALVAKAKQALAAKHQDAKALATSVISKDWKIEKVVEFTDTSRSEIHLRVTRSVSVQIIGRLGENTYLYTLYAGQTRKKDGSWGPIKSHLMYTDRMLAKNVDLRAP
jgi:hypothetical protein